MASSVKNKIAVGWACFKAMTLKQKIAAFVAANVVFPWTPVLMAATAVWGPPEVVEHMLSTGGVYKELVGSSWQLASHHFVEFVTSY